MARIPTVAAVVLAVLFGASACSDDAKPGGETYTAMSGAMFNDADVEFATEMIQQHAQALAMVDLARGRPLDREVEELAEEVLAAQSPEVEAMVDWLTDWGQPIPATVLDHANAHGDGETTMDSDMPGMMSADQMEELESAPDNEFQSLWLEMMIEHHRGAIEMAQAEQSDGLFRQAVNRAGRIVTAQRAEVETMEGIRSES